MHTVMHALNGDLTAHRSHFMTSCCVLQCGPLDVLHWLLSVIVTGVFLFIHISFLPVQLVLLFANHSNNDYHIFHSIAFRFTVLY